MEDSEKMDNLESLEKSNEPLKQINDLVMKMVTNNTLSDKALEWVKTLRDELQAMRNRVVYLERAKDGLEDELNTLKLQYQKLQKKEDDLNDGLKKLEQDKQNLNSDNQNLAISRAKLESDIAVKSLENTERLLSIVFKNPVYKESYFKSINNSTYENGYQKNNSTKSESGNIDKKVEE